ncbi:MAG: GRAM domain-containing protein, partial [Gemmataceae bacterium]
MGLFFTVQWGSPYGFVVGSAGGLPFGLLLAAFAAWQSSRFTRDVPRSEGEKLLKQGPANHFRGWEGAGGWLYLTDRRLLFRSHHFNAQNHELSVPLEEILEVETCSTAWVIPNGLRVVTARGAERFVVEGRRDWVEVIGKAKRGPSATVPEE